ncbi:UNVERIFIED_CONTAM: hypothetical protein GTU68_019630 [Idotea baltica]|nr:hypothetical protein [Idotea baltica]
MFKIPAKQYRHEELVKRSQFITTIAHASSADEANAFIASIKNEFPDASHNCWAYVAGSPGDTSKIGMSDDGEPHGTAGKPMLNVLLHSDVGEIVAVVTRYFGGTKLGPGGLVKAYSASVKNTLEGLTLSDKRILIRLKISFDYTHINTLKLIATSYQVEITEERYETAVYMTLDVPEDEKNNFKQAITDLTAGAIQFFDD